MSYSSDESELLRQDQSYQTHSKPPSLDPKNIPRTTSIALLQHQQEQELLHRYTIPNPPVSTQQSSAAAAAIPLNNGAGSSSSNTTTTTNNNNNNNTNSNSNKSSSSTNSIPSTADDQRIYNFDPSDTSPRTLWMGDLDPWLDERSIVDIWWQMLGKKVTVKIIKPKVNNVIIYHHQQQLLDGGLSHLGYCFVEFESFDDAQLALGLNGLLLPDIAMPSQQEFPNNPDNEKKYFRLNWASGATLTAPIIQTPEYSLFVGDLSASTTEAHLLAFFQNSFPNSIKTVRVMTDPVSGKSRCFGFVRFTEESHRQQALVELQGAMFGRRQLRLALATPRNRNQQQFQQNQNQNQFHNQQHQGQNQFHHQHQQQQGYQPQFHRQMPVFRPNGNYYYGYEQEPYYEEDPNHLGGTRPNESETDIKSPYLTTQPISPLPISHPGPPRGLGGHFTDPSNTTVFVGGLSSDVNEQTLFMLFKPFGIIQQVKIPPGKNCGFIKYSTREEAEEAIAAMQGYIIGGNRVRLSWGRVSMNNKKYQQQQQHVSQAAQMEAAMSMGLDPASALAAAGGFAPAQFPHSPQPPHQIPVGGPVGPGGPLGMGYQPHMMPPPLPHMMPPPGASFLPGEADQMGYNGPPPLPNETDSLVNSMEHMNLQNGPPPLGYQYYQHSHVPEQNLRTQQNEVQQDDNDTVSSPLESSNTATESTPTGEEQE